MMRALSFILAALLALCGCAFAEGSAEPAILQAADFEGLWNMEYTTSEGYMFTAEAYGLAVTLTLNADGSVEMDFNGEADDSMTWYMQDGSAFITGYNPEKDVQLLIDAYGTLEISDEVGSMFFTRPEEAAE